MPMGFPATYGYPGDVNNTIPMSNMYPGGRATSFVPPSAGNLGFRNNSAGELGALNQDAFLRYMSQPVGAQGSPAPSMAGNSGPAAAQQGAGRAMASGGTAPANSWLLFFVILVIFVWVMKRYDTAGNYGNLKVTLYNGVVLTFFIVLMLNLLKVLAAKVKVPGVSELILAA